VYRQLSAHETLLIKSRYDVKWRRVCEKLLRRSAFGVLSRPLLRVTYLLPQKPGTFQEL